MKIIPWLLPSLLVTVPVFAEGIATDGSLGAVQNLVGTNVTIPQELGKTVGNNLFHSFSDFNINTGQTVAFSGSDSLQNVISRVTGNNPSIIDGTLKSDIKNADFYFINPHGITFNTNALVDVPAAFHVSTADKIDFGKNGVFYVDLTKDSQLSSEPPSAFGFLGNSTIGNGLVYINNAHLQMKDGKTFDVVAGGINLEGNKDDDSFTGIEVAQGYIRLAALRGPGLIELNNSFGDINSLSTNDGGDINMDYGYINTTGDGAGRIDILGNNIQIKNSWSITSDNNGNTNAPSLNGINIKANNLYMLGSSISSSAINPTDENGNSIFIAKGNAGNITISANNSVKLTESSSLNSNTSSDGNAGVINITTKEFELLGSDLSSQFKAGYVDDKPILADGNLGMVNINASEHIKINAIPTARFGAGIYANTIILMTKYLDMNGGHIYSSRESEFINRDNDGTEYFGMTSFRNGKPGDIKIFASESIFMNSIILDKHLSGVSSYWDNLNWSSLIRSNTYNNEDAGTIYIKTKELTLIDSKISSSAFPLEQYTIDKKGNSYQTGIVATSGKAGSIEIDASEFIKMNNKEVPKEMGFGNFSSIDTDTSTNGDAGIIRINTKNLELTNSFISSECNTSEFYNINDITSGKGIDSLSIFESNSGNAGNIYVNANNIVIKTTNSYAGITSSTDSKFGAAGEVNVVANKINLYGEAVISSSSILDSSSGKIGDVNIKTQELMMEGGIISIENEALISDSNQQDLEITTNKIRNINLDAQNVSMDNAQITSASAQNNPSGNINIVVSNYLEMKNNSFITTTSNTGDGGSINVNAGDVTYLQDAGFITTVKGGQGNGGDISARINVLVMDKGIIQANAVSGNGGKIQLALEALIPSRNVLIQGGKPIVWNTSPTNINLIQAASENGVSGTVNNSAPQLNLSGVLANITNSNVDNNLISQDYCALGQGSSLSKKGKGALAMRPKDFQYF